MEINFKKKTVEIDANELREMQRKINILEHDVDVLNKEMTDITKQISRVERKVYRNTSPAEPDNNDQQKFNFWVPK